MKKSKITSHQLSAITACGTIGGSLIVISASVAGIAKQDAWLTALITPVFGIVIISIYYFLGSRYQGMTLIGITKKLFGKWVGFLISVGYVFLFLTTAFHFPWYVGDFTGHIMHETPIYAINLLFVAAVVAALLYGIETIARASELFIVFITVFFFLLVILVAPNAKIEYIQPILENGIVPVLTGTLPLSSVTALPMITIMMVYPLHVADIPAARKALLQGYLWAGFIIFVTIAITILVLGSNITSKLQYPTFSLARQINVGTLLTRLEHVISIIWIVTQFMIGVLFFYAGVTGFSELLGLKDYKIIVLPMGLIMLVMSQVVFPDTVYQTHWVSLVWLPFIVTFALIIPLLMLLMHFIKNRTSRRG